MKGSKKAYVVFHGDASNGGRGQRFDVAFRAEASGILQWAHIVGDNFLFSRCRGKKRKEKKSLEFSKTNSQLIFTALYNLETKATPFFRNNQKILLELDGEPSGSRISTRAVPTLAMSSTL